jgi:hypothetical protein
LGIKKKGAAEKNESRNPPNSYLDFSSNHFGAVFAPKTKPESATALI